MLGLSGYKILKHICMANT